jgi:excisionase family DNA binding protein
MNNEVREVSSMQQAQSVSWKAVKLTTNSIQSKANKKYTCLLGKTPALRNMDSFAQISANVAILQGDQMQTVVEPAMTVRDVATLLNVDEKTIYRLVTRGELPGFKVLGSWRFQKTDMRLWIDSRKQEAKLLHSKSKAAS